MGVFMVGGKYSPYWLIVFWSLGAPARLHSLWSNKMVEQRIAAIGLPCGSVLIGELADADWAVPSNNGSSLSSSLAF